MEAYVEEYVARGLSDVYVEHLQRELERWANWRKRRRSKPRLEVLPPELHVRLFQERTVHRAKATVYAVLSKLRGSEPFTLRSVGFQMRKSGCVECEKSSPDRRLGSEKRLKMPG